MDVTLSIIGSETRDGPEDLADWLRHEPELRGRVTPVYREPRPGELGAALDVLSVAVGSGGVLTVLAAALKTFLSQPRRSDVRVTIRTSDGTSVEIDATRVPDIEAVLRTALGKVD